MKEEQQNVEDKWKPKTELGMKVKKGEFMDIKSVFETKKPILEYEIVDVLLPNLKTDLLLIGQAKGKFGGGKRRAFRQTQKKTKEGNSLSFATFAVAGNEDGIVGVGIGKSKETIPAREKAIRNAKLNVMSVRRGKLSWEPNEAGPHTIPFKVAGKCGSSKITLIPAPLGTGLVAEKECQKILKMAGIKDLWAKGRGQTRVKCNLIKACINAFENLNNMRINQSHILNLNIIEGPTGISELADAEFIEKIKAKDLKKQKEGSRGKSKEKARWQKEKHEQKESKESKESKENKSKGRKKAKLEQAE